MKPWLVARAALTLLSRRDRRILRGLVAIQMVLSILDLVGVVLIGSVVVVSASALSGAEPSGVTGRLVDLLGWDADLVTVAVALAVTAALLLVSKSLLGYYVTRRSFRFLANRQAMVSSTLASRILSRPLLDIQRRSTQDTAVALTRGVSSLMLGVLGGAMIVVAEAALLLVLIVALALVDLWVTLFAIVFFAVVGLAVQGVLAKRSAFVGALNYDAELQSLVTIQESLKGYREISVLSRRGNYVRRFADYRWEVARAEAHQRLINVVTKYVYEVAMVLGGGLLAWSQFAFKSAAEALTVIAVFLAASSRILPSVMRMQTASLVMRNTAPQAVPALEMNDELDPSESHVKPLAGVTAEQMSHMSLDRYPGFVPEVRIRHAELCFPDASAPVLSNVDLDISAGQSVALVGPTGAGKSTLTDVLLGLLPLDSGEVQLSGMAPMEAIDRWPGAIAYVPQEVLVVDGSVRANVTLGLPADCVDDGLVWSCLQKVKLDEVFEQSRQGLETLVGENGVRLSGGQRQRLGLARALYSRPRMLVLDEATSALDAATESVVTDTLRSLIGDVTLLIVAHRLATVRDCDTVVYLERGRVVASGSFDDVVARVPQFQEQAHIMGLV